MTGQAAWYDLRVDVAPAPAGETGLYPAFDVAAPLPGARRAERARPRAAHPIHGRRTGARPRQRHDRARGDQAMKLGLVIDLDTCVGCHACAVACKQWNDQGQAGPAARRRRARRGTPSGTWFNRIRHFEVGEYPATQTVNMPMSCLHCEEPACVTVCPTGASYKRDDGIVLVDPDKCMGCNLCAWACPYGARELDPSAGRHEEVHAVRGSGVRRGAARGRAPARVRADLPDPGAHVRRPRRSRTATCRRSSPSAAATRRWRSSATGR